MTNPFPFPHNGAAQVLLLFVVIIGGGWALRLVALAVAGRWNDIQRRRELDRNDRWFREQFGVRHDTEV